MHQPLTGEPDAGDPPVRFGGRGAKALLPLFVMLSLRDVPRIAVNCRFVILV